MSHCGRWRSRETTYSGWRTLMRNRVSDDCRALRAVSHLIKCVAITRRPTWAMRSHVWRMQSRNVQHQEDYLLCLWLCCRPERPSEIKTMQWCQRTNCDHFDLQNNTYMHFNRTKFCRHFTFSFQTFLVFLCVIDRVIDCESWDYSVE